MKYVAMLLCAATVVLVGAWLVLARPGASPDRSGFVEASAYYARGDLEEARVRLKIHCDEHPHHDEARLLYARTCVESGRLAEAEPVLDELARDGGQVATVALLRASIERQRGEREVAMAILNKAIGRDPNNFRLWRELGILQAEARQPLPAFHSLNRSLQLKPGQEDLERLRQAVAHNVAAQGMPLSADPSRSTEVLQSIPGR